MLNKTLAAAAGLSLALTAMHVFGGGADVHVPLLETNASEVLKGYVSVVWHGITASLFLCSVMLIVAAQNTKFRTMLTGLVIAYYAAFAALFLFYGITRLGSVTQMPPWIGFILIVAVALIGLNQEKRVLNINPDIKHG